MTTTNLLSRFMILFTILTTATASHSTVRNLDETSSTELDQSKCGGCPCTSPCVVPSPPPPPPSPPPPALPPPPPYKKKYPPPTPTTVYCPPPPSTYIYITGPPGNLYPVDPNYSGSPTTANNFGFALMVISSLFILFW